MFTDPEQVKEFVSKHCVSGLPLLQFNGFFKVEEFPPEWSFNFDVLDRVAHAQGMKGINVVIGWNEKGHSLTFSAGMPLNEDYPRKKVLPLLDELNQLEGRRSKLDIFDEDHETTLIRRTALCDLTQLELQDGLFDALATHQIRNDLESFCRDCINDIYVLRDVAGIQFPGSQGRA